jgi:hypothetical protein
VTLVGVMRQGRRVPEAQQERHAVPGWLAGRPSHNNNTNTNKTNTYTNTTSVAVAVAVAQGPNLSTHPSLPPSLLPCHAASHRTRNTHHGARRVRRCFAHQSLRIRTLWQPRRSGTWADGPRPTRRASRRQIVAANDCDALSAAAAPQIRRLLLGPGSSLARVCRDLRRRLARHILCTVGRVWSCELAKRSAHRLAPGRALVSGRLDHGYRSEEGSRQGRHINTRRLPVHHAALCCASYKRHLLRRRG